MADSTNTNTVVIFHDQECFNTVSSLTDMYGISINTDEPRKFIFWAPATKEMLVIIAQYFDDSEEILELTDELPFGMKSETVHTLIIPENNAPIVINIEV